MLAGAFSVTQLTKESKPEIDIPIAIVSAMLPGATASDMELLVTDIIEERVEDLDDLDGYTSISSQGFSLITVSFDADSDSKEKITDLRNEVDLTKADLPDGVSDISVQQVSYSDLPILSMALSGPYELDDLKIYAEELEEELELIQNVSKVNIVGAPEKEIRVTLDQLQLSQYKISVNQISSSLAQSNIDMPLGSIETAGEAFPIRFAGRFLDVHDVSETIVAVKNGIPVRLRDVAKVDEISAENNIVTRHGSYGEDTQLSVVIDVYKRSGKGDILEISDDVFAVIASLEDSIFPDDVVVKVNQNDAKSIRDDLSVLLRSGAMTIVIILTVLILFLGLREALLASAVVPIAFFATFSVLLYIGSTINFLTLFSLILALGILVDAAIVVTESMFERIGKGKTPLNAAFETIEEFHRPLIAGTLTTLFAFLPMMFMSGIIGKFIESIPVTVTIVLTASIVIALGFITMLGTRFLKEKNGTEKEGGILAGSIVVMHAKYTKILGRLLRNRKESKYLLGTIVGLFVFALSLPFVGVLNIEMFPAEDRDAFTIDIENPIGTPLSVTNVMVEEVEAILLQDQRIESFVTRVGSGSAEGSLRSTGFGNKASFYVSIAHSSDSGSLSLIGEYEKSLLDVVNGDISLGQEASGPEQSYPVQIELLSTDLNDLETAAIIVANTLEKIDGARSVDNGIEEGNGELVIDIDRAKAHAYGITELQVAQTLRAAISGIEATTVQKSGDSIDVVIETTTGDMSAFGSLKKITVPELEGITISSSRGDVPISLFTKVRLASSRSAVHHKDGSRIVTVGSEILPGANTQNIVQTLKEQLSDLDIPSSVDISFGGDSQDINESFASLGVAMIAGISMILLLLIWQFNSFWQPLVVLTTVPLSLIGVFAGLLVTGQPFSFPGFIGIVALAGIVVNNAIILVDSINRNRRTEPDVTLAIEKSCKSRLQPILLTTITTVAGLLPLAFSNPTWAPLAVSIISGLLFSTILTLLAVPLLYQRFAGRFPDKDRN